ADLAATKLGQHIKAKTPLVVRDCRALIGLLALVEDSAVGGSREPLGGLFVEGSRLPSPQPLVADLDLRVLAPALCRRERRERLSDLLPVPLRPRLRPIGRAAVAGASLVRSTREQVPNLDPRRVLGSARLGPLGFYALLLHRGF